MNEIEKNGLAQMYNVRPDKVKVVYNPKDIRDFHNFTDTAWEISKKLKLMEKDVVQILPLCSTRIDSKGIDAVIYAIAALKRANKSVGLVIANSNASKMKVEIDGKIQMMKELGLKENEDYIFTSKILDNKPLDRASVANLFLISNIFVYGSWREVCPNVLLEAETNPNILLVLNEETRPLKEFGGKTFNDREVLYFRATSKAAGMPDGRASIKPVPYSKTYYDELAKKIIEILPSRDYVKRYSWENIWKQQMEPLIYGG